MGVDLMFKMAERAKELANLRIDELRMRIGSGDMPSQSIAQNHYKNRGELIEELLTEEFQREAERLDVLLDVQS